jgi:hypothetical protein
VPGDVLFVVLCAQDVDAAVNMQNNRLETIFFMGAPVEKNRPR